MKAMILPAIVSLSDTEAPLQLVDWPQPEPGDDDVLLQVMACGVCHTELDEIEGRTAPPRLPVVLGHEVVGRVVERGKHVTGRQVGERLGVGWIFSSTGDADENVRPEFVATGRDVDGGYAQYMRVPAAYTYPIPDAFSDVEAAPLLCAGGIGYRSLRLTGIGDGDALGLTGFGGSAHLVLQLVRGLYPQTRVYVFARDEQTRRFALELGATWAGDTADAAPEALTAIIDTTPAWWPVVCALKNLRPGGRLVINAIRKEEHDKSALLKLSYHEHLWLEKEIKSVANITRQDLAEFLPIAARLQLTARVETYPLEDANRALVDLKRGRVQGAKVLVVS